jgi:hypothetical protein
MTVPGGESFTAGLAFTVIQPSLQPLPRTPWFTA